MNVTTIFYNELSDGESVSEEITPPDEHDWFMIKIGRQTVATPNNWPHQFTKLVGQLELQLPDGSWEVRERFTAEGGIVNGKQGQLAHTALKAKLPQYSGRKARVRFHVVEGPLVTDEVDFSTWSG